MAEIEPIVLWISGKGGLGKSIFGQQLKSKQIPVFESDKFIIELEDWCQDIPLVGDYCEFAQEKIGCWLNLIVERGLADRFVELFFNQEHGFRVHAPICVIEGFMPYSLQLQIVKRIESAGCRVWIASGLEQLERLGKGQDWYDR